MNEELIRQIEELGLSNKEARVYVANLMLGSAGVQQIADTSGIKRVTTYVILEALAGLGLVSQTVKAKKTLFNAESPENLRRVLEKREQLLQDQKHQLEEMLPELGKLKSVPRETPTVKFYDTAEGIITVMKTFISEGKKAGVKKVYGISNLDQLHEFFPEIAEAQTNPDRVSSGITSQFIYTTKRGPIYNESDRAHNRDSRFVPLRQYGLNGDISIVGNKIAMLSLSGSRPIAVVIESKELSKAMLGVFELAWKAASDYQPDKP